MKDMKNQCISEGFCPNCSERLVCEYDENEEGDGKDRWWCEGCGYDPLAPAPALMDVVKIQHEEAEAS